MARCSVQDVCPVLPDTQGIYDKNHPAALGACMCQSKLVSAPMAWESARSSCIKLCIHTTFLSVSKKGSQSAQLSRLILDQIVTGPSPPAFSLSYCCCCYFCITFCYSQAVSFSPTTWNIKAVRDFFALGHVRVNIPLFLFAPFQSC